MEARQHAGDVPSALTAIVLVALILIQIYLGALVAGLDAGLTFNTWPLIDGAFIPAADRLWFEAPWWRNLFENTLTVQFNHRMMAYVLAAVVLVHAMDVVFKLDHHDAMAGALTLVALVGLQGAIGILTLINQVPIGFGTCTSGDGGAASDDCGPACRAPGGKTAPTLTLSAARRSRADISRHPDE
jgi:heme A synthase